ncbi:Gfo/Idh/MocA family protein [Planctobacterium marinum]|uniref:Oxidoreductase n=1 Tax=Planctobacterium marinum TaxID=1631968 RepID=A0AA48KNT3_9ALTE|nr:putative oxidoreductase [Planctobacterium marinum]
MSNKTVRWGLLGAGRITNTFAKDMPLVNNSVISAVAARSLNNAQAFAEKYAIEKAYEGYDALYADPDIDVIYISTPHTLHYEQTRKALLAGKHVLCEKPFVVSPEQGEELTQLAKQKGLFLMEAMWTWFLPAIQKAQQWVREGRIGELKEIQADFGFPIEYGPEKREWNVELAGGCTFDMGIYPVALNRLFNHDEPLNWQITGKRAENGADKTIKAILDYGDRLSILGSSFEYKLPNYAFILGTEGYVAIPDFWCASSAKLFNGDECIETFVDERKGTGFEFQIQHTVDSILAECSESQVVSHEDSLAFQRDIQRILTAF